jgi:hypothetical protein
MSIEVLLSILNRLILAKKIALLSLSYTFYYRKFLLGVKVSLFQFHQ